VKIGFWSIVMIALAISIIMLSYGYFQQYQPNREETDALKVYAGQLQAEANKRKQAEKRRSLAESMVLASAAQWGQIVAARTPPNNLRQGGINLAVNAWQLVIDARQYRNSVQRAVNKQLKVGGVKVINGPTVPAPSESPNAIVAQYFNYPAIPFPVVIFNLGQVTVQGTYRQIEANMMGWSHMPNYLAVADGLTFSGTSPVLTGTYNVEIVGYIRGDVVYPTVRESGGTGAGGGGGVPAAGAPGGRSGRLSAD
jgi:hypothetical protein